MNDFTKEELQEIIESFDWIESETSWEWKHPLRHKIQSMVDNYCEHPECYTDYDYQPLRCKACKEIIE